MLATLLLSGQTITGPGSSFRLDGASRTFHLTGITGSGAGTAAVNIEVSNDNNTWLLLGTISLILGPAIAADGFASAASWLFARGNVTGITGTSAQVTLTMAM